MAVVSFLVVSFIILEESMAILDESVVILVESVLTVVESVVLSVLALLLHAAKAPIANTNNNFFIVMNLCVN